MNVTRPATLAVFDRILCGVDGTPESFEAARQAERLRSEDGVLRLAAVTEVNTAVHAGFAMSHVLDELDTTARDGLQRAVGEVNPASRRLLAGEPAPCLLDEIERTKATLIAVGPRGHSRAAGILLGGVASTLLHEAPCSVLLARPSHFGEFPTSIIVGVDGSPQSLAAAAVAQAIAERFHSEYLIVAATGGKRIDLAPIQALSPYFVTDPSRPADALTELSKEADLLVVGSRGLHGPRALGSVSERVGHRASSSVLVVRDPQEAS
jgi:nucleotide-binding universal stress UspA family protein